jgi:hypothetical protein
MASVAAWAREPPDRPIHSRAAELPMLRDLQTLSGLGKCAASGYNTDVGEFGSQAG